MSSPVASPGKLKKLIFPAIVSEDLTTASWVSFHTIFPQLSPGWHLDYSLMRDLSQRHPAKPHVDFWPLKSHAVVTSAPLPNARPWISATLIKGSLFNEEKMELLFISILIYKYYFKKTWDAVETKLLNYVYNDKHTSKEGGTLSVHIMRNKIV